jgi:hypothetical protein
MAHRRREVYAVRGVRLSILAAAYADTPYTLMQISQTPPSVNPLADGAGHTFLRTPKGVDGAQGEKRGREYKGSAAILAIRERHRIRRSRRSIRPRARAKE